MATTKDELIKYLTTEKKLKQEKVMEVWAEKEKEAKDSGVTDPVQLEILTMRKLSLYFRKVASSAEEIPITIIPIGLGSATDYGAKKLYDEATKKYDDDPHTAILEGYTNEQGTPLWRGSQIQGRNGKPIQPEKELRRTVYFIGKREDDTIWKVGMLGLNGEALKHIPQIGKKYETHATIGKATKEKWQDARIIAYSGDLTKFENPAEPPESVIAMIEKYAKDLIVPYSQIKIRARMDGANNDFYFVKANVAKTAESMPGTSNRIVFSDPDELLFDEDKQLTGWISEDIPLTLRDESLDVYLLISARTFMKHDAEAFQINIFGYFADPQYIKTEENTPKVGNVGQQTELRVSEENISPW